MCKMKGLRKQKEVNTVRLVSKIFKRLKSMAIDDGFDQLRIEYN
jgi:hypothetical protein